MLPLCPAFRDAAKTTTALLAEGRLLRLVPWETTLTDLLLLQIGRQFPGRVLARRFDAAREAKSGADWEWWFRDGSGYAGLRVQAKRRDPATGNLGLRARSPGPPPSELQARRLVRSAGADGLTAFYCFYSDLVPSEADPASTGPCPHGAADPAQWGTSMLLARTALRHLETSRRLDSDAVAAQAHPWWRLVCPRSGETNGGPVAAVRGFVYSACATEAMRSQDFESIELTDDDWARLSEPPVGDEPPDDIRRAFATQSTEALTQRSGINGIALFDASPR